MFEKVNPKHPDKLCDCIAGALVDMAYARVNNPKIAVEVMLGHGKCHIIAETSVKLNKKEVKRAVYRIVGHKVKVDYKEVPQDIHLSNNQVGKVRCGDNGIFRGVPLTEEQLKLTDIAKDIFDVYPYDGKYVLDKSRLIICQSNAATSDLKKIFKKAVINPLGDWSGTEEVDTGITNRKLGSDMADSVTGGGLHGKDLSKKARNRFSARDARAGKEKERACKPKASTIRSTNTTPAASAWSPTSTTSPRTRSSSRASRSSSG